MPAHAKAPEPPSARRMATRERLLEAAAEVFTELGLQGAAVETICQRAGFTRGAFYSNFDSKEELFLTLLDQEFARRTELLRNHAAAMEPLLRAAKGELTPAQIARYVVEFLEPVAAASNWIILTLEFELLAMRDPMLAPDHAETFKMFYRKIGELAEGLVHSTGRRFVIPVDHAVSVFGGMYERAVRVSAFAGTAAPGGIDELGERIAELFFAITEAVPPPENPANGEVQRTDAEAQ